MEQLLNLSVEEKARRFDEIVLATHSHIDGRDLLAELHPRKTLDIKRRRDGVETWFEGDWLSTLFDARNGKRISEYHHIPTTQQPKDTE